MGETILNPKQMNVQEIVHPERRTLSASQEAITVDQWLSRSVAGDEDCRRRLFEWVHARAMEYFESKCGIEPLLHIQDAQDLASECVVEFSKCWTRVRSVTHYCRRMYKNNLRRFLKRKRRLLTRECVLNSDEVERFGREAISVHPNFEFERYSDDDERRLRFAAAELSQADAVIRELYHYRIFVGAMTYSEIADLVGATETSLRMRMARFNRRVRKRYESKCMCRSEV